MKVNIGKGKVKVDIKKDDVVDLRTTLAHIIVPALHLYWKRSQENGYVTYEQLDPADIPDYVSREGREAWDWVVDTMIYGFMVMEEEECICDEEHAEHGRKLFAKYYHHLWL